MPMDNPPQIIQLLESVGADLVNEYISKVSLLDQCELLGCLNDILDISSTCHHVWVAQN